MISRFERLLIALMFALLAAGVTLFVAQAQDGTNPPVDQQQVNQQGSNDCTKCHTEFQMTWQNGPHGQAGSDPVFLADWESQGKPGACLVCHTTGYDPATATWESNSVSCSACHTDTGGEHPKSTMTVERSPDLCGRCHSDTRFGWQDWQGSTHYQRGMNCTTCHDPHSASLKMTVNRVEGVASDMSQLCINCHQEASMNFPYSSHHKQGVACVDCHLEHLESADRAAHTVPDHSFTASLATCNKCHAGQMHADAPAVTTDGTSAPGQTVEPAPVVDALPVTPQPTPVSPVGYAGLAGLVGLAAGMVLAPWLERFYHRVVKHETSGDEKNG
jgi:predicted CXXCH cytochrome family protein